MIPGVPVLSSSGSGSSLADLLLAVLTQGRRSRQARVTFQKFGPMTSGRLAVMSSNSTPGSAAEELSSA